MRSAQGHRTRHSGPWRGLATLLVLTSSGSCTGTFDAASEPAGGAKRDRAGFSPVAECTHCHVKIGKQYSESMHAKAFTDPVFQAAYYDEFLPRLHEDPKAYAGVTSCLACHAPGAYMSSRHVASRRGQQVVASGDACSSCHADAIEEPGTAHEGIVCDVCHRTLGFRGDEPGNGNYIARPGQPKFGPFKHENNWHHAYGELQTKSEFCAICHSRHNRLGVQIQSTFDEWKASRFAEQGIQCQDCHMNVQGFLTDGKPVYESGKAATMTLGSAPERERLYTHRFVGAHSRSQVEGALTLENVVLWPVIKAGENIPVQIHIHNEKTGHKMPTGSVEMRVVYLDVVAHIDGLVVPLSYAGDGGAYSVSGRAGTDGEIYGDQIPPGRRLYQVVLADEQGRRTFRAYDAAAIVSDNRLAAGEERTEPFYLKVPRGARGEVKIVATLKYLGYPAIVARTLGLPLYEPIEFASTTTTVKIAD